MRIHTRTLRNTTLDHPSTHSDNDTDPKHNTCCQFRKHLDQSHNCLYLLLRVSGCALLILRWSTKEWLVAALGRRWTWRLGQVGGCYCQGLWVAKAAVIVKALRPSSEEIQLHVMSVVLRAFDARALGRDPRNHRGGTWANFSEHRVKSLHIISNPSQVLRGDAGEVGACIWKAHIEEDRNESTSRFERDLPQR